MAVAPFLDRLVPPWLLGQAHFDEFGKWPYPERSHGLEGVLEGFADRLRLSDMRAVERFVRLLVNRDPARGHTPCPCGSGLRLRDCHARLYEGERQALPQQALREYRRLLQPGRRGHHAA